MKQLKGLHHVTAITSDAKKIYEFYTNILGLRLVKKTVNQDDLRTYHLYFADDRGNPGTDMTFFDFKDIPHRQQGTNDISRTSFRVPSDEALNYWLKRFDHYQVEHTDIMKLFDKKVIFFEDFAAQQYALFSDEHNIGVAAGEPWHQGPVPDEYAIVGLGPIFLNVNDYKLMEQVLTQVLNMRKVATFKTHHLFEMGEGGNGAAVIVNVDETSAIAMQGYGGVHHVAFRIEDRAELDEWEAFFSQWHLPNSGFVDRFYFKSLYIRLFPNILFELATDGPGFIDDDESYEILGEKLTLPPHLRERSDYVEQQLTLFDTVRSTKVFKKEYFD